MLPSHMLGVIGAILIGFWYVFFYTDYPNLVKLFELCPFMQTVMRQENHVDSFILAHPQSPKIINFDIIFPYQNDTDLRGYSDTPPIYFTLRR